MKRLALLLPLLALAAAPARAEDPATNAAALPAWFDGIRVGMSTNEFFARVPDAKEVRNPRTDSEPGMIAYSLETGNDPFGADWFFLFKNDGLVASFAESGLKEGSLSGVRDAIVAELAVRFGEPDEKVWVPFYALIDSTDAFRISWTNETSILAVNLAEAIGRSDLTVLLAGRAFAMEDSEISTVLFGIVPDNLTADAIRNIRHFGADCVRTLIEKGEFERARSQALLLRGALIRAAEKAPSDDAEEFAEEARRLLALVTATNAPAAPEPHAESAEDAETNSRAEGEENASTGESSPDGATDMDEVSVVLERGFATRAPFPRSFCGSYLITRVYDRNSDKLLYALTPGDDGFCLDETLALAPKFTTIAGTISFVDENTSKKDRNLIVDLQFEFVRKESGKNPQPPQILLFRGDRFIQVLAQNDWDELQSARQSGSLDQYAKTKRRGKPKGIRRCDYLLKSEKEELKGLLNDPIETLAPSCGTLIEEFLRSYAPENAEEEGHAESAESESHAESAENAEPISHAESAEGAP